MLDSIPGVDPKRRAKLMQVLDIDPEWHMHRVSDGQRRRVQICLGLLKPPEVRILHICIILEKCCSLEFGTSPSLLSPMVLIGSCVNLWA